MERAQGERTARATALRRVVGIVNQFTPEDFKGGVMDELKTVCDGPATDEFESIYTAQYVNGPVHLFVNFAKYREPEDRDLRITERGARERDELERELDPSKYGEVIAYAPLQRSMTGVYVRRALLREQGGFVDLALRNREDPECGAPDKIMREKTDEKRARWLWACYAYRNVPFAEVFPRRRFSKALRGAMEDADRETRETCAPSGS